MHLLDLAPLSRDTLSAVVLAMHISRVPSLKGGFGADDVEEEGSVVRDVAMEREEFLTIIFGPSHHRARNPALWLTTATRFCFLG